MIHRSTIAAGFLACLIGRISAGPITGTVEVIENDPNNDPTSVSVAFAAPAPDGVSFVLPATNRGDYTFDFTAYLEDSESGALLSCVAERLRVNPSGSSYATASAAETSGNLLFLPVHESPGGGEFNANASFAFFPFDQWLAGLTSTPSSGTVPFAHATPGLQLGDATRPSTGRVTFDLTGFAATPADGLLLANSFVNDEFYALVETGATTFTTLNRDNGTEGALAQNFPISFAYVSRFDVGTRGVAAMARVNGDGSTDLAAGDFSVSKVGSGLWDVTVHGHSPATGTLFVQPITSGVTSADNVVSHEWTAGSTWRVESRDIEPGALNPQNIPDAEDAFGFVFFADPLPVANLTLTGPNLAASGRARQSSTSRMPLPARADATLAIDGDLAGLQTATDPDATGDSWWEVELAQPASVESVELMAGRHARHRLRDLEVQLLAEDRTLLATSPLLNPENGAFTFPGGPGSLRHDFATAVEPVRFVRVTRTADPDLSGTGGFGDDGVLSLGEVLVSGRFLPESPPAPPLVRFDALRPAPDPASQGFLPLDISTGATAADGGIATLANAGLSIDGEIAAWRIDDQLSDSSFDDASYARFLGVSELAEAYTLGWKLETRVKAITDSSSSHVGYVDVELNATDDPGWGLVNAGEIQLEFGKTPPTDGTPNAFFCRIPGTSTPLLLDAQSGDHFHTITAVGRPQSPLFDLYLDGVLRASDLDLTSSSTTVGAPRLHFGAGPGEGEAADFEFVTFETGASLDADLGNGLLFYLPFEPGPAGGSTYLERSRPPGGKPVVISTGGPDPLRVPGASGVAVDFPQTITGQTLGTYLDANQAAVDLGDLAEATVSLWVRGPGSNFFSLSNSAEPTSYTRLTIAGGNFWVETAENGGLVGDRLIADASALDDDEWHHLAVTYAPTGSKLYLDGLVIDTGTTSFTGAIDGIDTFSLGALVTSDAAQLAFKYVGALDEFAVWGRALDASEVATIHALGFRGSPLSPDPDGDTLNGFEETALGTLFHDADSDGDGIPDVEEAALGTHPADDDSDGDTLLDGDEVIAGTDPASADTDGDGAPDNTDPDALDPTVFPSISTADTDGDGLSDYEENTLTGTLANVPDSDGDGFDDFVELLLGSDPANPNSTPAAIDADGDGLSAAQDPNDAEPDADGDGFSDLVEINRGSDPDNPASVPTSATLTATGFALLPGGDVQIGFAASGAFTNLRIQSSENLGGFTDLEAVPVEPDGIYLITVTPPPGHRFFRAAAEDDASGETVISISSNLDLPAPGAGDLLGDGTVAVSEGGTYLQQVSFGSAYTGLLHYTITGLKPGGAPLDPRSGSIEVDNVTSATIALDFFDDLGVSQLARYTLSLDAGPGLVPGLDSTVTYLVGDNDQRWSGVLGIGGEQMNFVIEDAGNGSDTVQRFNATDPSGLFPLGSYAVSASFGATDFSATAGAIPLRRSVTAAGRPVSTVTSMTFTGTKPQRADTSIIESSIEGDVVILLRPPGGGEIERHGVFSLSEQPPLSPSVDLSELQ